MTNCCLINEKSTNLMKFLKNLLCAIWTRTTSHLNIETLYNSTHNLFWPLCVAQTQNTKLLSVRIRANDVISIGSIFFRFLITFCFWSTSRLTISMCCESWCQPKSPTRRRRENPTRRRRWCWALGLAPLGAATIKKSSRGKCLAAAGDSSVQFPPGLVTN